MPESLFYALDAKCLGLNKDDTRAQQELVYIQRQKAAPPR
jgi:hypothetical protein